MGQGAMPSQPTRLEVTQAQKRQLQCQPTSTRTMLWSGNDPLAQPRDRWRAEHVVGRRALTRATDESGLLVDLTLVMKACEFAGVWNNRRIFKLDGVDIPLARLIDIVASKHAAGRDTDQLFLATHREALEELLKGEDREASA